jgi:hypothetical protein
MDLASHSVMFWENSWYQNSEARNPCSQVQFLYLGLSTMFRRLNHVCDELALEKTVGWPDVQSTVGSSVLLCLPPLVYCWRPTVHKQHTNDDNKVTPIASAFLCTYYFPGIL